MYFIDLINGGFEFLGAPFILLSVIKLYRQKQVKGISWVHVGFFTVWGWWNLVYYPALGQWVSFAGGIAIVIVNTIWMGQLIYYSKIKTDPTIKSNPAKEDKNTSDNVTEPYGGRYG